MGLLKSFTGGVRALVQKERRSGEIDEEVRNYFDADVEEKMRRGMTRDEALRAARVEIGSSEGVRHKVWSAGWESTAESLWQDIRYGARQLWKSPGFSVVAILSLALGIGANTAIFTLIDDLLLKSLPVREPQQLVSFGKANGGGILGAVQPGPVDIFTYDFYRRLVSDPQLADEFQGITAFGSFPTTVSVRSGSAANGPATQAIIHLVSGTFFSVLGAEPMLGRAIGPQDNAAGRSPVAVVS